jgi:hypothetical protein
MWKLAIAAVAGFAVGVFVTKTYAENKVTSAVHSALPTALQGGVIESVTDQLLLGHS